MEIWIQINVLQILAKTIYGKLVKKLNPSHFNQSNTIPSQWHGAVLVYF
jgi:hypothetical protein